MSAGHVPLEELRRLRALDAPPEVRCLLFADACRINVLHMIARAGSGHVGSSLSSLDIVSWLFLEELDPSAGDVYFSSKGHDVPGLYAVLAALEVIPFEQIHRLRRLGGLPGHPDVTTPGIVTNTGSLGMGVSKAKGIALARRLLGRGGRVFVLTGDGELQEGQIWESLQQAALRGMRELTLIVDHNKLQSDTWVERVSALGDLEAKLRAFGWAVARCPGHDPRALAAALARLREAPGPRAIVADTVKGRGVPFMEHEAFGPDTRLYPYHSGAPSPEEHARAVEILLARVNEGLARLGERPLALAAEPRARRSGTAASGGRVQRLVGAYGEALVAAARRRPELVALDADLAKDCGLLAFERALPERLFECGIAEQDMVSQAGAMALSGLRPVVHSFACFLTARANEQIHNNATERTRVVYVGTLAGLLPAAPGHSHQAVRDIAALSGVPGMTMLAPAHEAEVGPALAWILDHAEGPAYLRLASIPWPVPFGPHPEAFETPGRGALLRPGGDVALVSYGPVMLSQAWHAAERLAAEGIEARVVHLPWLNRVDGAWLREALAGVRAVWVIDDHAPDSGLGARVAAALAAEGCPLAVRILGVEGIPACGAPEEALAAHGLDAASLARTVAAALEREAAAT